MIQETEWVRSANSLAQFKYFYAIKQGRYFVAIATKSPIGFDALPTSRGCVQISEAKEVSDDSAEARKKVEDWLKL